MSNKSMAEEYVMKKLIIIIFLLSSFKSFSEESLLIHYSAFLDTYFATDDDQLNMPWDEVPGSKYRKFASLGYLKDEFAINIAQIGADFEYGNKAKGAIFFQAGNLSEYLYGNYSSLQQAWIGYKIWNNLWIEAGQFLTHIGTEELTPKNNFLTSHSILTLFEPVYHQGIKFNWESDYYTIGLYLLNGSYILQENNDNKSIGTYLLIKPNKAFSFSYSGIYGNEEDGNLEQSKLMMYNNICLFVNPNEKINLKAQLDYVIKDNAYIDESDDTTSGSFLGFAAQMKYSMADYLAFSLRFAYFDNTYNIYQIKDNGFVNANYDYGYNGMSITAGFEYKPIQNGYIRFETRMLRLNEGEEKQNYPGRIFWDGEEFVNSRIEAMLNFGIWLNN